MEVELRKIKLTKSIISQLEFASIYKIQHCEILGYVVLVEKGKKTAKVILKDNDKYYWHYYYSKIDSRRDWCPINDKGEYENRTVIEFTVYNGTYSSQKAKTEEETLTLLSMYKAYKTTVISTGQIFY